MLKTHCRVTRTIGVAPTSSVGSLLTCARILAAGSTSVVWALAWTRTALRLRRRGALQTLPPLLLLLLHLAAAAAAPARCCRCCCKTACRCCIIMADASKVDALYLSHATVTGGPRVQERFQSPREK